MEKMNSTDDKVQKFQGDDADLEIQRSTDASVDENMSKESDMELQITPTDAPKAVVGFDDSSDIKGPPDGGYGWVVAIAGSFIIFFVLGNIYIFGVLYPIYLDVFDGSQASIVWIGSIGAGFLTAAGMLAGALSEYIGNREVGIIGAILIAIGYVLGSFATEIWHLYLTHGLIVGLGMCCSFISTIEAIGPWFTTRRGTAMGIAFAGAGIGQLVFSFVTKSLVDSFGWRGTLQALAIINGVGIALSCLPIKRFPPLKPTFSIQGAWHMFLDPTFLILYSGVVINGLGLYMPLIYTVTYAQDQGISNSDAVLINAICGLSSMLGRFGSGFIGDVYGHLNVYTTFMILGSVSTFCWLVCTTFPSFFAYSLIYSFFAGGVISILPAVCGEIFGAKSVGSVMGLLMSAQSIGNMFSSPIGGALFDATGGHYFYPITVVSVLMMIGGLILLVLPRITVKKPHEQSVAKSTEQGVIRKDSFHTTLSL